MPCELGDGRRARAMTMATSQTFKDGDRVTLILPFNEHGMNERGLTVGATGIVKVFGTPPRVGVQWDNCNPRFAGLTTVNVSDAQWKLHPITEFIDLVPSEDDEDEPPNTDTAPDPWRAFWRKVDTHLAERREFYVTLRRSEMTQ